ncbi:MAG: hypothetical protein O7G87_20445 [bacterium]|nr:hypothetical protein [bacterium]
MPDSRPETLYWTVHPLLQESRFKSTLLIAIISILSVAVAFSFEGSGWGFLTFAVLTAAMSRYFLPTRYTLNNQGITISHLGSRHLPWAGFQRAVPQPDGVFLSPFTSPHRLDVFRGCFIRFRDNQNEVLNVVRNHIPPNAS